MLWTSGPKFAEEAAVEAVARHTESRRIATAKCRQKFSREELCHRLGNDSLDRDYRFRNFDI